MKSTNSNKYLLVGTTLIITLGAILGWMFVYPKLRSNPASTTSPNVILISIDTLRADHLGTYGYSRDTSPNIDKLASVSTVFENANTPVPCTAPSYASLLTGLYPTTHQSYSSPLDKKFTTLAQNFKKAGYNTSAVVSSGLLANKVGDLGRGFDTYNEIDQSDVRDNRDNTYGVNGDTTSLQRGVRTTEEAGTWLAKNDKNKFFLFVHYVDPHLPYGEADPFKDKYVTGDKSNPLANAQRQADIMSKGSTNATDTQYLMDKYDENISYVDYQVGKLLDQIKAQGLYKNSIIILTADHGESFDHNSLGHCWRLYDSSLHIPLIIHDPAKPENSGKRDSELASLIDVYPTLSARIGFKKLTYNFDGIDLSQALSGAKLERDSVYTMTDPSHKDNLPTNTRDGFSGQLFGIITKTTRTIYNQNSGKVEHYNVANDPGETNNLFSQSGRDAYEKLLLWVEKNPLNNTNVKQNDARYKAMQGLGYL